MPNGHSMSYVAHPNRWENSIPMVIISWNMTHAIPRVMPSWGAPSRKASSTNSTQTSLRQVSCSGRLLSDLNLDIHAEFIVSSPYCTLSHLPGIATAPVLRAISSVGVVSILMSLATSAIFRLRMKLLKDPARQEAFAEVGSLSSVTPTASRHSC